MLFTTKVLNKLKRGCRLFSTELNLADKLDSLQQGRIGPPILLLQVNHLVSFAYNVTTGNADIKIFNGLAPFKFEVVDVIVQSRGTSNNGTIKLTNGTNDITDTITCAVDKVINRAGTIDNAYSEIAINETLQIVCAGDVVVSTIALVTVLVIAKESY